MSGHSKWANIKRKKGANDAEKAKIFTKIAKEIQVAVRTGGPDPDGNFRLKLCIQKAKANNMPADNITRCIQKAAGLGESNAIEEFFYEGYGAGGVAILCDMMTDNRNRTASEIKMCIRDRPKVVYFISSPLFHLLFNSQRLYRCSLILIISYLPDSGQ